MVTAAAARPKDTVSGRSEAPLNPAPAGVLELLKTERHTLNNEVCQAHETAGQPRLGLQPRIIASASEPKSLTRFPRRQRRRRPAASESQQPTWLLHAPRPSFCRAARGLSSRAAASPRIPARPATLGLAGFRFSFTLAGFLWPVEATQQLRRRPRYIFKLWQLYS